MKSTRMMFRDPQERPFRGFPVFLKPDVMSAAGVPVYTETPSPSGIPVVMFAPLDSRAASIIRDALVADGYELVSEKEEEV